MGLTSRRQLELHHTVEAASFFRQMAANEAKHGEELLERRQARMFMSARHAMRVALDAEIKAHDFFAAALPHVTDPEVRELFKELREEELEHQSLVRQHLAKLPPDPDVDPEDTMRMSR